MEPIDIYNSFDVKSAKRIGRNAKIIYKFAMYGSKGLGKINPVTVYIDAVISVGEATVAYCNYRTEKEVTNRLQTDLNEIIEIYTIQKRALKQQYKNYKKQLAMNKNVLEGEIEREKKEWINIYKPIYEKTRDYLVFLSQEIDELKIEHSNSKKLHEVESKLRDAINASLTVTIQSIGG